MATIIIKSTVPVVYEFIFRKGTVFYNKNANENNHLTPPQISPKNKF